MLTYLSVIERTITCFNSTTIGGAYGKVGH